MKTIKTAADIAALAEQDKDAVIEFKSFDAAVSAIDGRMNAIRETVRS